MKGEGWFYLLIIPGLNGRTTFVQFLFFFCQVYDTLYCQKSVPDVRRLLSLGTLLLVFPSLRMLAGLLVDLPKVVSFPLGFVSDRQNDSTSLSLLLSLCFLRLQTSVSWPLLSRRTSPSWYVQTSVGVDSWMTVYMSPFVNSGPFLGRLSFSVRLPRSLESVRTLIKYKGGATHPFSNYLVFLLWVFPQ